jgi:DNA-binding MarR family transcriptional regulator
MNNSDSELLKMFPIFNKLLYLNIGQVKYSKVDVEITPRCFDVMRVIYEEGPINMSAVGAQLLISRAQMTQLVARLIKQKMIVKMFNKDDKRFVYLNLTKDGKKCIEEHIKMWEEGCRKILSSLSQEDYEEIVDALQKLKLLLDNNLTRMVHK